MSSEPSVEQFLRLGDVITVTDEKNGLLVANDPVKSRAYVSSLDSSAQTKFTSLAYLFQIRPPSIYQAEKNYRKVVESESCYLENQFKKRSWKDSPVPSSPDRTESKDIYCQKSHDNLEKNKKNIKEENIGSLFRLLEQERDQNASERLRLQGKIVLYGQNIELFNIHLEKNIQVNPRETCDHETNNLRVDFTNNLGKTCLFKILPRYRVRVEGEPVRLGDRVVFKCLKTGGYINRSSLKFYHEISHNSVSEVCNDTKLYSWKVNLFQHVLQEENARVYTGQLVRFYHKEREAYLQTSPDYNKPYLQSFQVNPINPAETKDSSAFWRIEKEDPFQGGAIKWGDKIRLRHPTTGSYLAIIKPKIASSSKSNGLPKLLIDTHPGGEFVIVEDLTYENLTATLFQFHPVATHHSHLYIGSFIQIQHIATKLWLHVGSSLKKPIGGKAVGAETNRTSIEFNQLEVIISEEELSENCFSVSLVESEFIPKINLIESLLPSINRFIISPRVPVKSPDGIETKFHMSHKEFTRMKRVLISLIYFCSESSELDPLERIGIAVPDNQHLLRESGIIRKLCLILRLPFDLELRHEIAKDISLGRNPTLSTFKRPAIESVLVFEDLKSNSESNLRELLTLIYKLIQQFLLGPNIANQNYLGSHLSTFWSHLGLGIHSPQAVVNLLKDNLNIIESVDEDKVMNIVNKLPGGQGKDASYLDILAVLCGNNKYPMRRNQSLILDKMLRNSLDRDLIYHTTINPKTEEVEVQVVVNGTPKRIRLDKFLSSTQPISTLSSEGPQLKRSTAPNKLSHQSSSRANSMDTHKTEIRSTIRLSNRIQFFESTLRLFQAVCAGRNIDAIYSITHELRFLTFDNCLMALSNRNLPYSIRAQYCYLLITFFIDIPPMNPVTIDNSYSIEDTKNNSNNFNMERFVNNSTSSSSPGELDRSFSEPFDSSIPKTNEPISSEEPNFIALFSRSQSPAILEFDKIHRFLTNFILDHSSVNGRSPDPKARCLLAGVLKLIRTLLVFGFYVKHKLIRALAKNLLNILDSRHETSDSQYAFKEGTQHIIEAKIEICGILEKMIEFRTYVRARKLLYHWRLLEDISSISEDKNSCIAHANDGPKMRSLVDQIIKESTYVSRSKELVPILMDLLKYQNDRLRSAALTVLFKAHSNYYDFFSKANDIFILTLPEHIRVHNWIKPRLAEFKSIISQHRMKDSVDLESRIVEILDDFYILCSDLGSVDFDGNLIRRFIKPGLSVDVNPIHQILFINFEVHTTVLSYIQTYLRAAQSYITAGKKCNVKIILACSRFLEIVCKKNMELQNTIVLKNLDLLIETMQYDSSIAIEFIEFFSNHQFVCISISERQIAQIIQLCTGKETNHFQLLKVLVKVNGRTVKRNQNLIAKLIVENRNLLLPAKFLVGGGSTTASQLDTNEEKYLCELLNLLTLTAEGDNSFTKALCQTIFFPSSLLGHVLQNKTPVPLKDAYLRLFIAVYADNNDQPMQDISTHPLIWQLIREANFLAIEMLHPSDLDPITIEFFFETILPFLKIFYEYHYDSKNYIDTDLEHTIEFSNQLLQNLHKIPFEQLSNPNHETAILSTVEKLATQGGFRHSLNRHDILSLRQNIDKSLMSFSPKSPAFLSSFNSQSSVSELDETNARLKEFMVHFKANPTIIQLCLEEFSILSSYFELIPGQKSTPPVFYIIQHLSETNQDILDERKEFVDIISLKIIARLLLPTVELMEKTSHVDNPEQFKELLKKRNEIQCELDSFGCTNMAEQLLSSSCVQISEAALELLVVLLSGGNRQVQNTLEEYFMGTRQERFFHYAHFSIRQSIDTLEEAKQLIFSNKKKSHSRANSYSSAPLRSFTVRRKNQARVNPRTSSLKLEDEKLKIEREAQGVFLAEIESELSLLTSDKSSLDRMKKMMRLIQLFVEGHNFSLQNYLRFQPDNIKSFDLIKDIVDYFRSIVTIAHANNIELIIQILDTITELAQGCVKNQIHIFNCKIVQTINIILRDSFVSYSAPLVLILKGKAVQCLLSLLEDFNEETRPVFEEMAFLLDLRIVLNNLNNLYEENYTFLQSRQKTSVNTLLDEKSESYAAAIETGFFYTMVIMTLFNQFSEEERFLINESHAYHFFRQHTGRIEILREITPGDKKLLQVLFPIPEICKYLADDVKHNFLWTVNRESPTSKIQDLVFKSEDVIFMVKNRALIARSSGRLFLTENRSFWWKGAFGVTLALQLLLLISVQGSEGLDPNLSYVFTYTWFRPLRILLGTLQTSFWLLTAAEFSLIQLPNLVNHNRLARTNLLVGDSYFTDLLDFFDVLWVKTAVEYLLEPRFLYHIGLAILSIMGLAYPFLYAIHLLDFVYRDEILQGVIASVTVNFHSLSRTALLGVVIIYIYSVIAFLAFRDAFDPSNGLFCDSLWSCFITVLSHGVRAGGGLGDLLSPPARDGLYKYRIFVDMTFFLLVIIFLLNVIFGIIFDTFGRLRDERSSVLQDMRNVCFICNIEASEFQRHAKGFDHHIKHDHNMWQYLFFLIHLNTKEVTEYNAHESYVADMLAEKDLNFFPVNRALCLKDREQDKDEQLVSIEGALSVTSKKVDLLTIQLNLLREQLSLATGAQLASSPYST